jgi:hypothetical protein
LARRTHDAYFTAPYQVYALLAHQRIGGTVLECCNGDGSISDIIRPYCTSLVTNDIDLDRTADAHLDAASPTFAEDIGHFGDRGGRFDWICSNRRRSKQKTCGIDGPAARICAASSHVCPANRSDPVAPRPVYMHTHMHVREPP